MLAVLVIATMMSLTSVGKMGPSYAQSTFDTP
jgi:predicted small lipoprotein YifL